MRWMDVEPSLRESALAAGVADAITGFSTAAPFLTIQGVHPSRIRVLRYADHGLDLYSSALFARAAFLQSNADAVLRFARAFNEALQLSIAQPEVAITALRQLAPRADVALETARLRTTLAELIITPTVRRHGLAHVDRERLARNIADVAAALKLPAPATGAVYTDALLPPLALRQLPR